jgi:shikimate kinase
LKRNVALVGFMGSGKSTAARAVGLAAVDSDDLVEQSAGKSIPEIFREDGEAAFRRYEEEAIALALGGGAVTSSKVRGALG